MYHASGAYWATLTRPDPAPVRIQIGPWQFVLDGDRYTEEPRDDSATDVYRGPVTYHVEQENRPDDES